MEMKRAQLMSLTLLILFVLMLSILLTFAELTLNYSNVAESVALSSTTTNYGQTLQPGISALVRASATRALTVLAEYEYQPTLRGSNFVTSFNTSLASLMVSNTLPGVSPSSAAGKFISNAMGNFTIAAYNAILLNSINATYRVVSISQTMPNVTQYNPYNISVTFVESVTMNTVTGTYHYAIPVNVSVPLTGTPDIYYAQRGIWQYINFTNSARATGAIAGQGHSSISGLNLAVAGNDIGVAYGTVYTVPGGVTCSSGSNPLNSYLPAQLTTAPLNHTIILVTPNAAGISNTVCNIANNYGGLITNSITNPLGIPWLVVSSSSGMLSSLQTGQQVLIYGPEFSVLNVSKAQAAFYNGYYMASPFAPSYSSRVDGYLSTANPDGIFNLQGYNQQVAYLAGTTSNIIKIPNTATDTLSGNTFTVTGWIDPTAQSSNNIVFSSWSGAAGTWIFDIGTSNSKPYAEVRNSGGTTYSLAGPSSLNNNQWYYFAFTLNNTAMAYYVNGTLQAQSSAFTGVVYPFSSGSCEYAIGDQECGATSNTFTGQVSNVQMYSVALTPGQIRSLYSEGIEGVPAAGTSLAGWWPLNGNSNDYSGEGNGGAATGVAYALADNYSYDGIFGTAVTAGTGLAVPGILSCTSNSQCSSSSLPHLILGTSPLEVGPEQYAAQFIGPNSMITTKNPIVTSGTGETVSAWIYISSTPSGVATAVTSEPSGGASQGDAININQGGSDNVNYRLYNGAWNSVIYTGSLSLNTWYQVTGTYNGASAVLYINGVAVNTLSTPGSIVQATSPGYIGSYGQSQYFPGSVSDVQYYSTALSASQVLSLYQEGLAGIPVTSASANIVAWWPLNDNTNDYSGNGNTGNAMNVSYAPVGVSSTTYIPWQTGTSTTQNERQYFGFT